MYVAVKGGEQAILNTHTLIAEERRGDRQEPELSLAQIEQQFGLAVDRVMTEGSLYDRELAALALKQARGDTVEAIFLLRAYRTTLPRFGSSRPIDTAKMNLRRRISATFKDLPGGQILGPTYDYTHRLLDFGLAKCATEPAPEQTAAPPIGVASHADLESQPAHAGTAPLNREGHSEPSPAPHDAATPRVTDILAHQGLIEEESIPPSDVGEAADITRKPVRYPGARDQRLQQLARADEGWLLALGYSTQRGFGRNHPFAGEIRLGEVSVEFVPEELGFAIEIGEITVTECQMINQFKGSKTKPPQFTRGYGLGFGHCERKTMGMALVDRALRANELEEDVNYPAQDEEFVLAHSDNVEASGFVQHLKLPHYVDFQSELVLVRKLRESAEARQQGPPEPPEGPE